MQNGGRRSCLFFSPTNDYNMNITWAFQEYYILNLAKIIQRDFNEILYILNPFSIGQATPNFGNFQSKICHVEQTNFIKHIRIILNMLV